MGPSALPRLGAVVLFSENPEPLVRFYEEIGLEFEPEDHGDGPLHFECELPTTHFAIFPADHAGDAPRRNATDTTFLGFEVDDVGATIDRLRSNDYQIDEEPTEYPWGLRGVVRDPDGRRVEIFN